MPEPIAATAALSPTTAWQLLRHKWQMARHRMRRHERGDIHRMLVVTVLGALFWGTAFAIVLKLLRYFRSAEDIGALLAAKLLSMILLSFG